MNTLKVIFTITIVFISFTASGYFKKVTIKSLELNQIREVKIYKLNIGSRDKKTLTAIYMLDEGNDDELLFETAKSLNIKNLLVVAISNIDRGYDFRPPYTMTRGDNVRPGNGKKFVSFIKSELIPFIDKKYGKPS